MSEPERDPEVAARGTFAKSPSPTPLGAWIRKSRVEQRLSQTELARRAGLSRSHAGKIERGQITSPGVTSLDRLAAALGAGRAEILAAAGILEPAPGSRENEVEGRFMTVFRSLNADDQAAVERFARFLQAEERRWSQPRLIAESVEAETGPDRQPGPALFDVNALTPVETDSGDAPE